MTEDESPSNDQEVSPREQLVERTAQAEDEIKTAHQVYDEAPRIVTEVESIKDEWCDDVAALEAETDETLTSAITQAKTLADASNHHSRTQFKQALEAARDEHSTGSRDDQPLDEWLLDRVDRVVVSRTTDHRADTEWTWHIRGSQTFTTKVTKDGIEHFDPSTIRSKIYQLTGDFPSNPDDLAGANSWVEWVVEFIRDRAEHSVTDGRRSIVAENLMDWINRTDAYTSLEDAVNGRSAIAVDEDAGDLLVPIDHINRVREEGDLSYRALQIELEARGWLSENVNGASRQEYIDDGDETRVVRVWVFSLSHIPAEPARIIEDPETPAEQVAAERDDEGDGDSDDDDVQRPGGDESSGLRDRLDLGDPTPDAGAEDDPGESEGETPEDADAESNTDDAVTAVRRYFDREVGINPVTADEIADSIVFDRDAVESAIEELLHNGEIYAPEDDAYLAVSDDLVGDSDE